MLAPAMIWIAGYPSIMMDGVNIPVQKFRGGYFEVFHIRTEALKREYAIKRMKSTKYLQSLIATWCSRN
jgi:hypothetical protein